MTNSAWRGPAALAIFAAFLWGVAESTWFFVVADVLLTFIALRFGFRTAIFASVAAATGALCGGAYLWVLATNDPPAALDVLNAVPLLTPGLIERGMATMAAPYWPFGMLTGSFTGVPYKIFAVGAGQQMTPLAWFLAASLPVRLVRFVLASAAVAVADGWIGRRMSPPRKALGLLLFWVVFYGQFWLRMSLATG
ncbi:hypothetical protein C3941_07055 [Kaistia algarum]|uniref:hypothetical protein n=1 Tax=Kaistia algarum TaxID=2083279 RepID=UPI000CE83D1F|nr:hypothetical protein [Kaistia algarum]MCX5515566.1 hypothetical protein [Kaistia algarum]PPE81037.1 hypothetical protein C3941_07055 [Kaistia algarum]